MKVGRVIEKLLGELIKSPIGPGVGIIPSILHHLLGSKIGIPSCHVGSLTRIVHGVVAPTRARAYPQTKP